MNCKNLCVSDINRVVEIHKNAFKNFFLTSLGTDFLKTYYKSAVKSEMCTSIGLFEKDKLMGFAIIANNSEGFNSKLVKENLNDFLVLGTKMLLTKPKSLFRLFKNFTKSNGNVSDDQNYGELLSIGVDPSMQGKGAGKLLLKEIEVIAQKKGIRKIVLTTDFYDNESTVAFYRKVGYHLFYDFIAYPDRRMYKMYKNIWKI